MHTANHYITAAAIAGKIKVPQLNPRRRPPTVPPATAVPADWNRGYGACGRRSASADRSRWWRPAIAATCPR